MRKLELKDIAGYLPHRLKMMVCSKDALGVCARIDFNGKEIKIDERDVYTMGKDFDGMECVDVGYCAGVPLERAMPILRPLSDLRHIITHNGREIVPIIELAKIAYPGTDWYLVDCGAEHDTGYDYIKFSFTEKDRSFSKSNGGVANQAAIFDFLHELKIDFRGLIDDGLAIDCNALKINPYK
jgi:hypothetical protein